MSVAARPAPPAPDVVPPVPRALSFVTVKRNVALAGIQKVLPATGDTLVDLGSLQPGTYRYTCGMGMYSGSITAVA